MAFSLSGGPTTSSFFPSLEIQPVFSLSGGSTTSRSFPLCETLHVKATANTSDRNSFSLCDQGNCFQYLKQDMIKP